MPRPRIPEVFVERIATLAEEGYRPAEIARRLEKEAIEAKRNDWPALRTVQRHYEEHMNKPEDIRRRAALVRWPQSFLEGAIPWEASAAVFELLRYRDEQGYGRPTIRVAKWFWLASLVCPGTETTIRAGFAADLATWEWLQEIQHKDATAIDLEGLEGYLVYQPWRSEEDYEAYEHALEREHDPLRPFRLGIRGGLASTRQYLTNIFGEQEATRRLDEIFIAREQQRLEKTTTREGQDD